MRRLLLVALTFAVSLVGAGSAQAVVVDLGAVGQPTVSYNPSDQSGYFGVALVPGSRATLATAGIPTVTSAAACSDPWLSPDLTLPSSGLCWHPGGSVLRANETFALTWDPVRRYWQTTRNYVEQFLRDVASGSRMLTSPYAVTGQYRDTTAQAANASLYGGGCIDYGNPGGYTCQFGNTTGAGVGLNYPPAGGCQAVVSGTNQFYEFPSGAFGTANNDICLTDSDIQKEVKAIVSSTQVSARHQPGYTPTIVVMTPPGVEICLDAAGKLCSANGASAAQFCSYHAQVNGIDYIVQPWTALTACDEPGVPPIPANPSAQALALAIGQRLVSPLSQAHIASIVNPGLNGWFANDGSEINDNGCVPLPTNLDKVTVGNSGQNPYWLQREFNNTGVIETDPNSLTCAPSVALSPAFVIPSGVNPGDVVQFDGSATVSTLIVPKSNYVWNYGDGTTAVGPSVEHAYVKAGNYTVKLTVIDRGGNVASLSQQITVGTTGQPVTPPPTSHGHSTLRARLQLLPQGLRTMLRAGVAVRVSSNQAADGIATLSISRAAAHRAQISTGRGTTVVIGRGTVSGLRNGTVKLHLHVSRAIAKKLSHLKHVTLTVRLMLIGAGRSHLTIDAAGHY